MCTFRRPRDAAASLEALSNQDIDLESVVVVDNAGDEETRILVENAALPTRYLAPGSNLGPAGGVALAIDQLPARNNDLVVLLDDDDPLPVRPDLLASMIGRLESESAANSAIVGVGLRGGSLDTRTGLIKPRPDGEMATVAADHIHGGAYPIYRLGPLKSVGAFDHSLFWGFEELAAGRALRTSGYGLVVAGDLLDSVIGELPKLAPSVRRNGLAQPSWHHYFRHRNLLRVLRREGAWVAIAVVIVTRMIGKPVLHMWRHPRLAMWHLRTNLAATIDGIGPESRMERGAKRRPV